MKKRILFIMLALVLALSVGIMGCNGGQQEEEEEEEEEEPRTVITLDFATFWPSGDFQPKDGEVNWMQVLSDRVLAETDDYELEWVTAYSKHPANDLWPGVVGGTYDCITSGPGYCAGTMSLWEGTEYGATGLCRKNALTMSMALKSLYEESTALQEQVLGTGVVPMYFWSVGPGYFLMTEGNHVETLADLAALPHPIRAATPGSDATIKALGAESLYCPMSAALENFEAGLLAGILCPTDTPKGFGLGAYVRTGTFAPFSYGFVFMNVMNKDTYDGLPAEVRAIFDEVNDAWTEYSGKLRTWGEYDGIEYCNDEVAGFFIYDLATEDPTEYAAWEDACAQLVPDWIAAEDSTTRQEIIDRFVYWDNYYCTTEPWASWEHSWPTKPPVPSF